MTSDPVSLPGGQDLATFLRDHWQQRPALLRGELPAALPCLDAGELAGLALEADVESRVIMGDTEAEDWMLLHGPFEREFFADTPDRDWTLLVQDVDKHLPAMAAALDPYRFAPNWRLDDLMVSYAAPGGTVGPHVDRYDVFLLQVEGRRHWRIQQPPPARERLRTDSPLRLLADFVATHEWVLEPGDMLYLPPGIPHYGIALDECITYSIGFRAPSAGDLLSAWARHLAETDGASRYTPRADTVTVAPGRLAAEDASGLRELLIDAVANDREILDAFLGDYLTEPKPAFRQLERAEPVTLDWLQSHLGGNDCLRRNPAVRFLGVAGHAERVHVHGAPWPIPTPARAAVAELLDTDRVTNAHLPMDTAGLEDTLTLLLDWTNAGYLLTSGDFQDDH